MDNMGNHEFCVDCGASDFHNGEPCDPVKKFHYQNRGNPKKLTAYQKRKAIAKAQEAKEWLAKLKREEDWKNEQEYKDNHGEGCLQKLTEKPDYDSYYNPRQEKRTDQLVDELQSMVRFLYRNSQKLEKRISELEDKQNGPQNI